MGNFSVIQLVQLRFFLSLVLTRVSLGIIEWRALLKGRIGGVSGHWSHNQQVMRQRATKWSCHLIASKFVARYFIQLYQWTTNLMVKAASMYPLETHLLRAETPQERQVLRRKDKKTGRKLGPNPRPRDNESTTLTTGPAPWPSLYSELNQEI